MAGTLSMVIYPTTQYRFRRINHPYQKIVSLQYSICIALSFCTDPNLPIGRVEIRVCSSFYCFISGVGVTCLTVSSVFLTLQTTSFSIFVLSLALSALLIRHHYTPAPRRLYDFYNLIPLPFVFWVTRALFVSSVIFRTILVWYIVCFLYILPPPQHLNLRFQHAIFFFFFFFLLWDIASVLPIPSKLGLRYFISYH